MKQTEQYKLDVKSMKPDEFMAKYPNEKPSHKINPSDKNNSTTGQIFALVENHHSNTVKEGPEFTDVSAQDLQWIMDHLDFLRERCEKQEAQIVAREDSMRVRERVADLWEGRHKAFTTKLKKVEKLLSLCKRSISDIVADKFLDEAIAELEATDENKT